MASSAASRAREAAAEALDRRVRPILDQIDLRNYKQAIKLADTAIKKYGNHPLYQTVKAMAMERMGRKQEALELVNTVRAGPLNEHLLGMMQPIYRNLTRYDDATKAYEKFASDDPMNPERQILLFNAYAREYDYLKQQQVAMKLFKQSGREHFLMWAVCTLELQSLAAEGGPLGGGARMLQLAEALLRKKMSLSGLEGLESLLVFLSILDLQQKHGAALEVIQGPAGALFTLPADRARLEGELQHKLGHYTEAAAAFASVLRISPDDWAALQGYLDALLEYTPAPANQSQAAAHPEGEAAPQSSITPVSRKGEPKKKTGLTIDEVDRRLAEAQGLLAELQGFVVQSGELMRGPFLAEVELAKRRAESSHTAEGAAEGEQRVAQSIAKYFEKHGHMVSFAMDVRQHVLFIKGRDSAHWLASELHASAERSAAVADAKPIHGLRRRVAALQVEEQLGLVQRLSDQELYDRAVRLARLYQENVHHLKGVAPRERGPAEELLVMAVTCLVEGYVRTRALGLLSEAILVLEQGLFDRRWQSEYKLMLVSLYLHVGAVGPALAWYRLLDIKHIQLETMSHHVLQGLLGTAQRDSSLSLFRELAFFHDSHVRDAADMTLTAYRNGTYSKVREFVRFKERLERSHQRLVGRVEALLIKVAEKANNATEVQVLLADVNFGREPLEWSSAERLGEMSFNEDLDTRPWWTPSLEESLLDAGPDLSEADRQPWHERDTQRARIEREARWRLSVRRRCLLPRLLALTLELGSSTPGQTSPNLVEQASTVPAKASEKTGTGKGKKRRGTKADAEKPGGKIQTLTSNGAAEVMRGQAPDSTRGEVRAKADSGAPHPELEEMRALVDEYAEILGLDREAAAKPDLGVHHQGGSLAAEVLSHAVFTTSLRVMEAREVLAGRGEEAEAGLQAAAALPESFQSLLRQLQTLDESITGRLFTKVSPDGGSLSVLSPGSALPQLATLVNEGAAWLLLSVQSWARVFPAALKRKKKAAPDEEATDDSRTLAMHALRSLVCGVEGVLKTQAERCAQHLRDSEIVDLVQGLRGGLGLGKSTETTSQRGQVLGALQSWSQERQLAVMQTRKEMSGGVEDENEEAMQVLDLEATVSTCLGSSREILEQIRTAALLKGNAFRKVNV